MSKENLSHEEQVEKIGELIKDVRIAMLTTACPDGSLRSRPMATQNEKFDGTVWFFTRSDSGKVHEIQDEQHVNISYSDAGSQVYVSVSGTARLNHDRAKIDELWSPVAKAWFPDGKDDPQLALIEITVDSAEYWDSPAAAVVKLVGFAKAIVTGKTYNPGENEKVEM